MNLNNYSECVNCKIPLHILAVYLLCFVCFCVFSLLCFVFRFVLIANLHVYIYVPVSLSFYPFATHIYIGKMESIWMNISFSLLYDIDSWYSSGSIV